MKTFTKILIVLIIILIENSVLAQDSIYCKGIMSITDTIVVKKRHQQAVELNVHISFPTTDTVILHRFRENVYTQGTIITIDSIHYNLYDAIQLFQPSNVGSFGLDISWKTPKEIKLWPVLHSCHFIHVIELKTK